MPIAPRSCRKCGHEFTPSREEVRYCTRCRLATLPVREVRKATLPEPDCHVYRSLGDGGYQRNKFAGAGAL